MSEEGGFGEGVRLIARERKRQQQEEGYTSQHDQGHRRGELAWAAACYAAPGSIYTLEPTSRGKLLRDPWPWGDHDDKRAVDTERATRPRAERIRELSKAGALIAAEIDRLSRLT